MDEINKAINIVKSNYVFNLETSTQLSSFFGNELMAKKLSLNNLENHLKYWNNLDNFKEITKYLREDKFTLIASSVNVKKIFLNNKKEFFNCINLD